MPVDCIGPSHPSLDYDTGVAGVEREMLIVIALAREWKLRNRAHTATLSRTTHLDPSSQCFPRA